MRFPAFIFLSILASACTASVDQEAEAAAITMAARAFSQAYMDGDLEKQMSFYTQDAVIIPGNRPMIKGIAGITRYWRLPESVKVLHHQTISTQLEINGNLASDYGIYEGTSLRNQDTLSFKGQYVITWRKESDGQWRMAVDMWSALSE